MFTVTDRRHKLRETFSPRFRFKGNNLVETPRIEAFNDSRLLFFRENARAKEKRNGVIVSDRIETKTGCSQDTQPDGSAVYTQIGLN